ncbi:hypothetical protein B0H14DRAFT_2633718 [Mycena olivaceomarginata]|nr:hypothetical protein B0H14DRAFT_2633718 [Mycena olivaceomarginata]
MSQSSITDYTNMQCFQQCSAPGRVYESFLSELKEKPDLLANTELIGSAKHPANIFQVEHWGLNSLLKVGTSADAAVYHAVVSFSSLGKIADATHGTVIRANGNHYEGGLEAAREPLTENLEKLTSFIKESSVQLRRLAITMTPSNTENAASAASTPQVREENLQSLRVRRRRDSSPEPAVIKERETNEFKYKSGDWTDFELPLDSEIRLCAGYDPRVYYDFNGPPYFMLESAMATQLNICDHNKAPIPPWKLYNAFRPGALIMAIVQTFQLEAKQIWVYDEGDGAVVIRRPPVPHNPTSFSPAMSTPYTPQRGMTDLFSTDHQTPGTPTPASKSAGPSSLQETLGSFDIIDDSENSCEAPPRKRSKGTASREKGKSSGRRGTGFA